MKGERTRRRGAIRQAAVVRNLLHLWNQIQPRHRKNRRVQNLANVASSFRTVIMRVQEREARSDVQQQQAAQNGQRGPGQTSSGNLP
jgi:hypothetical protein